MKKRNCAETIVTAALACSLCGGMITAYAGTDSVAAERQAARGYGLEREEVSAGAADVPHESPKPSGEGSGGNLVELHNPILNEETGDVTFSYIDFGSYPQGEVTGDALTEDIMDADYVNGDAVVDGVKYRRVSIPKRATTERPGERKEESGQIRYFKYEPIRWLLVDMQDGKAVLRTEKILDYKIYNGTYDEIKRFSVNWMGTVLQYWLNGYDEKDEQTGFLQTAFSGQEAACIVATEYNDNGNKGADLVFILCSSEWVQGKYWYRTAEHVNIAMKSDYANIFSPNQDEKPGAWWLRDTSYNPSGVKPYYNAKGIHCFRWHADGFTEYEPELMKVFANDTGIGVCPAIAVELSKLESYLQEIEVSEVPATKEPLPSQITVKGDLDSNGEVNLSDAQMALKAALKIMSLDDTAQKAADADDDGMITLADAQIILKMALKIIIK